MNDVPTDLSRRIAEMSPGRRAYLERLLESRAAVPEAAQLRPRPRSSGVPVPCSFAQQRLWFLDRLDPGSAAYIIVSALPLPGTIDVEALEMALQEIVRRHEVLRTTFSELDGEPVQVIAPVADVPLRRVSFQSRRRAEAEAALARLTSQESRQPFDLERGPLLRTTFVRLSRHASVLLLAMHHIVTDGWSMKMLYRELEILYAAFAAGKPSPLPPLPLQYADFAIWQRTWLTGDVLAGQLAYWRKQLAGLPRLDLPTDYPRPPLKTFSGASHGWRVPVGIVRALRELSQGEGVTMFMALLAALAALLSRYSGQTDIVVGSPIANRTRVEIEELLGFFVNTLVLRVDLSGAPSFRTLLARVRETALGAYAHQDLPFERLVEELQPQRDLGRNPLFAVMFQLQSSGNALHYAREGEGDSIMPAREVSVFDLSLDMWENGDDLAAQFEYSTDLFDRHTIVRMSGHFVTLLEAAVSDPDAPVTTLPLLTAAERRQIVADWNDTAAEIPRARLHSLIEAQARRTPESLAVRAQERPLTYEGLNRRANGVAHALRARGVGRESIVAVRLDRSPELVVALLGVLKAGAAYLPIDPAAPAGRVASMLADAGSCFTIDGGTMPLLAGDDVDPDVDGSPDDLACVIYTSGSTGAAKGVEITHRSLVNHALAVGDAFDLRPGDCVLQFASIAFDVAGEEIFPALVHGAAVAPARNDSLHAAEALLAQVEEDGVTVLDLPTPLWQAWMAALTAAALPASLRLLVVGSDRAAEGTLARWRQRVAPTPVRLMHGYGVTEATITSLLSHVSDDQPELLIGRPIANTEAYVLDAHGQPVPVGVPGELFLGGLGLARGYRGRPDLTAQRFIGKGEGRLYRTGDLVRYRQDGQLEFLGRLDEQIKLHGYRIEPAEVEAALVRHTDVAEARVIRREDRPGDPRLVAYLVAANGVQPGSDLLAQFLRDQLPEAMIPAAYVWMETLPLTGNGKLDRAALPAPGPARPRLQTEFAAPQTQLERDVARVWSEVLQLESVGREDNFFDLGGRSLLLVRVHSQLRRLIGDRVSILDLFRYPTVRGLAAHLHASAAGEVSP